MPNTRQELYKDLSEGQMVGPDHHKFQLNGTPTDCSLGQLWSADDISTREPIKVKLIFLDPIFLLNKSFLANFKKQIIRSKPIKHSHVASIYGYFIHRGGLLFFAFEAVDSLNLEQLITSSASHSLSLKQTQGLVTQLARGVSSCTNQWHIALGGIDSQFVFINKKGGVKFLPLSMREFFHDTDDLPKSVYFYKSLCSPEALGDNKIDLDSDCYALALVTYTLLGGQELSHTDSVSQRTGTVFIRPKNITDEQWLALQKALAPEAENRYPCGKEFIKSFFSENQQQAVSKSAIGRETQPIQTATDSTLSAIKSGINISFSLSGKKLAFKLPYYAIALLIFVVGAAIGFILGVYSSAEKINNANQQAAKWQGQAKNITIENNQKTQQLLDKISNLTNKLKNTSGENKQLQLHKMDDINKALPLSIFRDPLKQGNYGPDMVTIDAGHFMMGSSAIDANDNERPAVLINIKQKFAIARYETTFEQYDFFANQTGRALPDDEGWGRQKQPVINISWNDALAYTQWLAKETQLPYRLPTEAEWEYAARAGSTSNFWWGDVSEPGYAQCSGCGNSLDGKQPLPVGSLKANLWGLHDFNGNVDEWVADCYKPDHLNASKAGEAHQSVNCENRTMRGGSWFDIPRITRSASRYKQPPKATLNSWGFRVALAIKK